MAYASAKAAVIHFSKMPGNMYASKGMRVHSVPPDMMYRPLPEMSGKSESAEDRKIHRKHNVPRGSTGDAFDLGNCVASRASGASSYSIGQNSVVFSATVVGRP